MEMYIVEINARRVKVDVGRVLSVFAISIKNTRMKNSSFCIFRDIGHIVPFLIIFELIEGVSGSKLTHVAVAKEKASFIFLGWIFMF
jgi:hypothetical protein